ncbi:hypothetical protein BGZ58_008416 [Dissophora ornata]|nr:hypothetical protein BGZ58_008416 [Dissophora ornata]
MTIKEVIFYGATGAGHRHRRVQQIHASPSQLCSPDPHNATAPSLFINFPNITHWQVDFPTLVVRIPNDTIKNEVIRYCPRLRSVSLRSKGTFATEMLVHVFENLHDLIIFSKDLTSDVAMAILVHQKTLAGIHVVDHWKHGSKEANGTTEPGLICSSSWIVQMLPQICSNLRSLKIPGHEMDIAEVEKANWSCDKLERLHIKVRGLNSKDQINQVLHMWLSGKNKRKRKNSDGLAQ